MKSASKIGDELALGDLEAGVERAGLVARAVGAVEVHGVDAAVAEALDVGAHEGRGLVGRVVEDLDLERVGRVVHLRDGIEEARGHRRLVEERELDRHDRQLGLVDRRRAPGAPRCDLAAVARSTGAPGAGGGGRTRSGRGERAKYRTHRSVLSIENSG